MTLTHVSTWDFNILYISSYTEINKPIRVQILLLLCNDTRALAKL